MAEIRSRHLTSITSNNITIHGDDFGIAGSARHKINNYRSTSSIPSVKRRNPSDHSLETETHEEPLDDDLFESSGNEHYAKGKENLEGAKQINNDGSLSRSRQ